MRALARCIGVATICREVQAPDETRPGAENGTGLGQGRDETLARDTILQKICENRV